MKLIKKTREGSKIIKEHDIPRTPYQRVLESTFVQEKTKSLLKKQFENLNPFKLRKIIDDKIATIQRLAR